MRWRLGAIVLAALWAFPALARADSFDPVSFGVQLSTLGYGITLERPLLFDLSARIATGTLSLSQQVRVDGRPWNATVQESNVLVASDWRPYGGRWRLSAGVLFGSDHVDWTALPTGSSYTLNGHAYGAGAAGSVTSQVSFSHPALYLGAGGGTGILKGLTIAFDAGFVIRNGTVTASATGPLASDPAFQSDLAATVTNFRTRVIQPVVGVGLVFRP